MDPFLDEDFEILRRLKHDLKHDDNELRAMLNKKRLNHFELDLLMGN